MKLPIRTITLGTADPHPLPPASVKQARSAAEHALRSYQRGGYDVQTVRLSTRPILRDLASWKAEGILDYAGELAQLAAAAPFDFCSVGTALLGTPPDRIQILADLLADQDMLSATVQVASPESGINTAAVRIAASIIRHLADRTPESFGNFRFAAVANVAAGGAFFPSAYHTGPTSLSIGTQGADAITAAARPGLSIGDITARLHAAITDHALPIARIGMEASAGADVQFGGIDLSPAPGAGSSIAAGLESFGFGPVGSPGTITLTAAVTAALRGTDVPKCGYNGLMLPVLEDSVLGERWAQGCLDAHKLLCYSAVCGTGLDTVPLPGNTPQPHIERLIMDVATLALRLDKPLSARLMPVAGTQHGDRTSFTSPFLLNTVVHDLQPSSDLPG